MLKSYPSPRTLLSDSALNVGAQYFAPAPQCPPTQPPTPPPQAQFFFGEADFFISFIPQNPPKNPKSTQKSKIQINPSHQTPYIYNVYPPPPKKSKKHLPISKKSTNFALAKSQTAHLQPSQSRAKAHQKPNCKNFFKKSVKNLHSPNKGCNFASLSAREEIISRERFF